MAQAAWRKGWKVHVNDHLVSAAITSIARVTSFAQAQFRGTRGYANAIRMLNTVEPVRGFVWREYCPASYGHCGVARMYFTEENASRIDGIRTQIKKWSTEGTTSEIETWVLLADLIEATNRVANTAGTYGCFLRRWQRQSRQRIELKARLLSNQTPTGTMSSEDVMNLKYRPDDTVYFDPPYTKRQYAAYYHILETIALGDTPLVRGIGGIRPWHEKASDYCYKARALKALETLVKDCVAQRVFMSYSTEGHVPLDALKRTFAKYGSVSLLELDQIGRYTPNRTASKTASHVKEVLFKIERTANSKSVFDL